jgi:aminopeptidase YwaD
MRKIFSSKILRLFFFSSFCLLCLPFCWVDEVSLLPPDLIQAIINEVSGEIALQNEIMLAPYERLRTKEEFTTRLWESTYIMRKAQEYGLQEVQLHTFPSDDPLWQVQKGELWMIEPAKKKLADVEEIAAHVATMSHSTDVEAELVYLERASRHADYEGKDVSGKIILTADSIGRVQRIGVIDKGALGVVSYASYTPLKYIDTVGWQWGMGAWDEEKPDKPTFGFSISRRTAHELKSLLLQGKKVKVHARIKAIEHPGREEVVSAIIPGTDLKDEEFVLIAHLFEGVNKQGANDNNSGCASILEVARTIAQLIKDGKIEQPRRTIRFLWVPEISGTIKYLEKYPEITRRMVSGINMDMVGCDLYKNNSPFHIYRTPYSLPSYINYVAESILDYTVKTNRMSIEYQPYMTIVAPSGSRQQFMCWMDEYDSGSDHIVFNHRQVKVPMVFFCNWPDDFYHSSEDAPKNSDATQLKRSSFLGTAITLAVANADKEDALKIAADSLSRIRSRLGLSQKKAYNLLGLSDTENMAKVYKRAVNLIKQNYFVELQGLMSCASLAENETELLKYIDSLKNRLTSEIEVSLKELHQHYELLCQMRGVEPIILKPTADEERLAKLIPVVKTEEVWPLLGRKLIINWVYNGAYEAFNFIDGKRSILDIAQAMDAEFIDSGVVPIDAIEEFINALAKDGLVEIKPAS